MNMTAGENKNGIRKALELSYVRLASSLIRQQMKVPKQTTRGKKGANIFFPNFLGKESRVYSCVGIAEDFLVFRADFLVCSRCGLHHFSISPSHTRTLSLFLSLLSESPRARANYPMAQKSNRLLSFFFFFMLSWPIGIQGS